MALTKISGSILKDPLNLGEVSIGGTLTYEDVTNVDSIGIITARSNIDCNGDLDVDGHTNLDNVSIAGVTTFAGAVTTGDHLTLTGQNPRITFTDSNHNPDFELYGSAGIFQVWDSTNSVGRLVVNSDGHVDIAGNLDVGAGIDVTGDVTLTDSIIHDGDTDTKIRFPAADTITAETGGAERFRITSGGSAIFNHTAVGTSYNFNGPSSDNNWGGYLKLHSYNGSTVQAEIRASTQGIRFGTGGSERLRITSGGKVNIGGQYPQSVHALSANASDGSCIMVGNTSGSSGGSHDAQIVASDGSNFNNLKLTGHGVKVFTNVSGSGISETMHVTRNGYVTIPRNPSFFAYGGTAGRTILPPATKVTFNGVNNSVQALNFSGGSRNSGYSTSNSRFTAPITGTYHFTCAMYWYSDNAGNINSIVPRVNGSELMNGGDIVFMFSHDFDGNAQNQDGFTQSGSITLNLAANDYVEIWRRSGNTGNSYYYTGHSHFCGFFLG